MDAGAAVVARLRANGLTVALTETGRIQVRPRDRITREMHRWILAQRDGMVAALRAEQAQSPALPPLQSDFTAVPNVLIDILAPQLTEAELRVLLYLTRRIRGFHRQEDAVSLTQLCTGVTTRGGEQLDHGTGLRRKAVMHALDQLERRGLIARVRSSQGEHGHGTNVYRLTLERHSAAPE